MPTSRRARPLARFAAVAAAVVALSSALAPPASAQTLSSSTLPLVAENGARWNFYGDKAIAIRNVTKGGQVISVIDAFALSDSKPLWHVEQAAGTDKLDTRPQYLPDRDGNRWYIGTGPLSCLDLETGKILWTIPCDQLGYVELSFSRTIPGHRMLLSASKKCDPGKLWDARKEPVYAMIDTETGKVLWRYMTKPLEYESGLGYWARVAKYQGKHVEGDKHLQMSAFFVTADNMVTENSSDNPDRLTIAGEQLESIKLADGSVIFKTKDKPGILRGQDKNHLYFREGDKLTAYEPATGKPNWTFDLKEKTGRVYTADDLIAEKHDLPDDMTDIMISESDIVSRVSASTGKALYSVKRGGKAWQGSKHALLVKGDDKTIAYDWNTGAKLWEAKVGSKPKGFDVGDYIVFVDSKERTSIGLPIPPFQLTTVQGKTGQVVWSKKDLNGKKIDVCMTPLPGIVAIAAGPDIAFLNVADGTPAVASAPTSASAQADSAALEGEEESYSLEWADKSVTCRDRGGKVVWQRKGEAYIPPEGQPRRGLVIWPTADGTVEVIGLADGATKWKTKVDKEPYVTVNADWNYLIVPNKGKKDVTLVKLTP